VLQRDSGERKRGNSERTEEEARVKVEEEERRKRESERRGRWESFMSCASLDTSNHRREFDKDVSETGEST